MCFQTFDPEYRIKIEYKSTEMEDVAEVIEALERKFCLEDVVLDVTDERCNFLDSTLR